MPLASPSGPQWMRGTPLAKRREFGWPNAFRQVWEAIRRRFTGSRRRPRATGEEGPGMAGAGDRSPLRPLVPTLSGGNARRLEDAGE